jgi:ABC-type spermidine/putrescine transport system permease subunit I
MNKKLSNEIIAFKKKELYSWFLSAPSYLWLIIFFFLPYLMVFIFSFFKTGIYDIEYEFSLTAYREAIQINYFKSFYLSFRLAFFTTLICIFIGYPAAYYIARRTEKVKNALLLLIVIPFWTNFVIRIFSWRIFLSPDGMMNSLLINLHIITSPIRMLRTELAVLLVSVYVYLPYMILPLYSTIEKIDFSLLDAASDLGASPFKAFLRITLPLSEQGILAGAILVFIPALGTYVIPQLVGNQNSLYIGQIITNRIKNIPRNWPLASTLSFFLLILIVILLFIFYYLNAKIKKNGTNNEN